MQANLRVGRFSIEKRKTFLKEASGWVSLVLPWIYELFLFSDHQELCDMFACELEIISNRKFQDKLLFTFMCHNKSNTITLLSHLGCCNGRKLQKFCGISHTSLVKFKVCSTALCNSNFVKLINDFNGLCPAKSETFWRPWLRLWQSKKEG